MTGLFDQLDFKPIAETISGFAGRPGTVTGIMGV